MIVIARAVNLAIQHPELRQSGVTNPHSVAGLCYVVCEALWHHSMREEGWNPARLVHEDTPHWILIRGDEICDPTVAQFATTPDYATAKRRPFRTPFPSRRARTLLALLWGAGQEAGRA